MIKISDILESTRVPVKRLKYSGNADPYITYFYYNENGIAFADDTEIQTGYYLQVDIWTKGDFTELYNQVKKLMTDAGFKRTYATELYESDTKIKHKVVRFFYTQNNENEEE